MTDPAPVAPTLLARLNEADRRLSERLVVTPRADGQPRRWLVALRRFSEAGSYGIGWVAAFAVVGIVSDGFARGAVAAAMVVAMLGVNTVVKQIIRRPRPAARAIAHAPTSFSMPSAHTSMAMVGAATMQVVVPDQTVLWWCVASALAISRILLGMHYVADVLVGAALGIACGMLIAAPLVQSVG